MSEKETSPRTHKDLIVWNKAMDLVVEVYAISTSFPKEEVYSLTQQMKRSAVSIPSNIAEGAARRSKKEFVQFLRIALGSIAELETQLVLASRLSFFSSSRVFESIEQVRKLILGLLRSLKSAPITHHSSRMTSGT